MFHLHTGIPTRHGLTWLDCFCGTPYGRLGPFLLVHHGLKIDLATSSSLPQSTDHQNFSFPGSFPTGSPIRQQYLAYCVSYQLWNQMSIWEMMFRNRNPVYF